MTDNHAHSRDSAGGHPVVTRRGLLVASALTLLGVGGLAACARPRAAEEVAVNRESPRLGAMVGLPVDAADVARWHADIDTLAEHGQNLVRTGIYAWMVAPTPLMWDTAHVEFFRTELNYARDRGMQVNLVVPGAPDWAQSYGTDDYVAACTWFWTQMRESFGGQVDLWQAFNEADHSHFQKFTPVAGNSAYLTEFAEMLALARKTLGRDGVPVTTNLTGWPMNDEREREWLTTLDVIGGALDVIGIDLYPADNEDEISRLPERLNRVLRRYGKPVFVAEIGLQTTPDAWTEADQQQYVTAAIGQLRTVDLWGIALYELRDNPSPAGFGIKRSDGTLKPAFADVLQAMSPR